MIQNILNSIENQKISISEWLIGFTGIVFIRFLLEFFSDRPADGNFMAIDTLSMVHYWLFFFVALFGVSLIIWLAVGKTKNPVKMFLYGLPMAWLAPILDIIISHGNGFKMTYIFDNGQKLLFDFLTFFGPLTGSGATIGIRIELFIIFIGVGLYVWSVRRKVWPAILAVLISYTFVFILGALPGVMYTVVHPSMTTTSADTSHFIGDIMKNSSLISNSVGIEQTQLNFVLYEYGFNKIMSEMFFVLAVFFTG